MRRHRFHLVTLLLALALAAMAAGCGGDGDDGGSAGGESTGTAEGSGGASGSISIMGVWTGPEQKAFQAVLDGFTEQNPDVDVKYTSAGDQLPTQLSTAVEGGNPPDMALLPQPGLVKDFVGKNALKPLDFAKEDVQTNLGDDAVTLGSVDGSSTASSSRPPTSRPFGTTSRRSRMPASSRLRPSTTCSRPRRPSMHLASRPTRSVAPTVGRSPTCSRTSTSARPVPTSTTSCPRMKSRGRTSRSRTL